MIKILDLFFNFIVMAKHNNKFLVNLRNSWLYREFIFDYWRTFNGLYHYYRYLSPNKPNPFYAENAERVNRVANTLADEKSKKTYLGMVKFRQTYKIRYFPLSLYEKREYFIKELKLGDNEVFVDCGAYDGDTIYAFLKRCPAYKQIIAFEPQKETFEILSQKYGNNPKITLINAGVFDKDGEISFIGGAFDSGARIKSGTMTDNLTVIKTKTIDGLNLQNVSFIKMDIEGAELNALKGAEKTILRDKPKLAICIYHSDDDMIRVAEYIHDLLPEYKLYVKQHYKYVFNETVLYALP